MLQQQKGMNTNSGSEIFRHVTHHVFICWKTRKEAYIENLPTFIEGVKDLVL